MTEVLTAIYTQYAAENPSKATEYVGKRNTGQMQMHKEPCCSRQLFDSHWHHFIQWEAISHICVTFPSQTLTRHTMSCYVKTTVKHSPNCRNSYRSIRRGTRLYSGLTPSEKLIQRLYIYYSNGVFCRDQTLIMITEIQYIELWLRTRPYPHTSGRQHSEVTTVFAGTLYLVHYDTADGRLVIVRKRNYRVMMVIWVIT